MLENLKGEYEAVVFSLKPIGYIIVNINDLTIPELSFQNQNPFQDSIHPIYNGPLGYYAKENKKIISLKDSSVLSMEKVDYIYSKPKIEHLKLVDPVSEESNQQSRSINVEKRLKGTLKTWYISGNNCGSIASAICMSFYRDYVNLHYVDNYHTGKDALIALMQQ